MQATIGFKTFVERASQNVYPFTRVKKAFLFGVGNKAQFCEYRWHGSGAKHKKSSLMNPFVTPPSGNVLPLNAPGQIHTLLHIAILHKLKDDIAFRFARIEIVVGLFVIVLLSDDTVFPFSYFKIFRSAVHSQGIGFGTHGTDFPGRG